MKVPVFQSEVQTQVLSGIQQPIRSNMKDSGFAELWSGRLRPDEGVQTTALPTLVDLRLSAIPVEQTPVSGKALATGLLEITGG